MQTKSVSLAKFSTVRFVEPNSCANNVLQTLHYKIMVSAFIIYHLIQYVIRQVSITAKSQSVFSAQVVP